MTHMLLCYPLHFTVVMRPAHQPVFFNTTTCMEKPILSTSTRWTVDKREMVYGHGLKVGNRKP